MPRDHAGFPADILEHISNIEEFLAGKDVEAFTNDKQCRQSVYWSLFAISEAVTEVLRQDPALEIDITDHRDIRSARNLLAHGYFAVNPVRIWDTCTNSLPVLRAEVEEIARRPNMLGN